MLQEQGVACELVENQKPRMYYADQEPMCDYVLKLKKYDVGFRREKDGSYLPVFDDFTGEVSDFLGAPRKQSNYHSTREESAAIREYNQSAPIGKLMQAYSLCAAMNEAEAQGHTVDSWEYDEEGNIVLSILAQSY